MYIYMINTIRFINIRFNMYNKKQETTKIYVQVLCGKCAFDSLKPIFGSH